MNKKVIIVLIVLVVIYFVFLNNWWQGGSIYQNFRNKMRKSKQYNDCLKSPDTKRLSLRDNKTPEELCKGLKA